MTRALKGIVIFTFFSALFSVAAAAGLYDPGRTPLNSNRPQFNIQTVPDDPTNDTAAVLSFEGGNLYKADKIYIAQLSGTYYEMGRQYGYLLKDQINSYYQKAIVEHSPWGGSWSREDAQSLAERYYSYYPARTKEVFNGMTETSGLPVDDLILIDQYTELFVISAAFGCSSMAAWGDYTTDGKVVMGKNEDMPAFFKEFNGSLSVIVFNPTDGSRSVASVCNAGQVKTMNAISDVGISHATLQAPFLEGLDPTMKRVPLFISHLAFLLDSDNLDAMEAEIASYLPPVPINGTVADAQSAFSYEASQSRVVVRDADDDGVTAQTNHYVDPVWGVSEGTTRIDWWLESEERRSNLLALAELYKGTIDAQLMMEIFDLYKNEGGATVEDTTYQVVFKPSNRTIWVKAPDYQDWVEIDLNLYFSD